jgi:acyl-coenzyme A synthetase/AMP-(fatty) acid ligase
MSAAQPPPPAVIYHTGDVAARDDEGYITYIGRTDDVFKTSDYRISPFELESVLIDHEAVAEAAVVPSPDPIRLAVPKAYVSVVAGHDPTRETALDIMRLARAPRTIQAGAAARVRRATEDDFGQNPPSRAAQCRAGAPVRRRAAAGPLTGRVLGG